MIKLSTKQRDVPFLSSLRNYKHNKLTPTLIFLTGKRHMSPKPKFNTTNESTLGSHLQPRIFKQKKVCNRNRKNNIYSMFPVK